MKCHYRSATGRLVFEIEGSNQKEIFEGIAGLQEVFEADDSCGHCGNKDIRFRVREVTKANKTFKYFELACPKCYAKLAFGQSQDTVSLFPKRFGEDKQPLLERGWSKYIPKDE